MLLCHLVAFQSKLPRDVSVQFACLQSCLIELEPDIRPYLAAMIVRAVHRAGDALIVPRNLRISTMADDEFDQYQLSLAAKTYNMYGALSQMVQNKTD